MHTLQALEREALGGAGRDVDQKPRCAPPLVLLGVDVERGAADLAELHVMGRNRKLASFRQIGEVPSQHPPDWKNMSGPWAASRR